MTSKTWERVAAFQNWDQADIHRLSLIRQEGKGMNEVRIRFDCGTYVVEVS